MFSIICVFNNRTILNDYLIESLNRQNAPFELILIDNTTQIHASAAKAFNTAAQRAAGEYLLFVHQDVRLMSDRWLTEVEEQLRGLDALGSAGVAGRSSSGSFTNLLSSDPPKHPGGKRLSEPVSVQTIDGCLLIVAKSTWTELAFDETAITGWYLYTADYCLDLLRMGRTNYVIPHEVFHLSPGPPLATAYMGTLRRIVKKHKPFHRTIYTTTGIWHTTGLSLQIAFKRMRLFLKASYSRRD